MKKEIKIWVGSGLFCVLLLLASVWYAVAYNDSRLVEPMDFSSYVFQTKDLPMLLSGALIALYAVALAAALLRRALKARRRGGETSTRRLNPKLGLLGLLGFLGFGGFWTYGVDGTVFPFAFFLFFGFFGFYYEGKMSGTFMDERFRENAARASLRASNVAFSILMLALVVFCRGRLFGSLEYTLIALLITLSLTLALRIFLAEYLLYRYDYDERLDEGEEEGMTVSYLNDEEMQVFIDAVQPLYEEFAASGIEPNFEEYYAFAQELNEKNSAQAE